MEYVYALPTSTTFKADRVAGDEYGPIKQKFDIYRISSTVEDHGCVMSRRVSTNYYVISGQGCFAIAGGRYDVTSGMLVEVPPKVEYSYSGSMELLCFHRRDWLKRNNTFKRCNPDVQSPRSLLLPSTESALSRLARLRLFGKSPVNAFLRLNRLLWERIPTNARAASPVRWYGAFLHRLVQLGAFRTQYLNTFFLRNRPQLELIRRLAERRSGAAPFRVAVLGCSVGAEAYSIAWIIRRKRPDFALTLDATDISTEVLAVAKRGVYPVTSPTLPTDDILERMSRVEIDEVFDRDGDAFRVRPWIREGIEWHEKDVRNHEALYELGTYDLVVANNFLCHMNVASAEACLRKIGGLVRADGYVIVSGVDLDVRTKVATELGWRPVEELLEEIHEGDRTLREVWPFLYCGLEPLDKARRDWRQRYAAAFQVPGAVRPPQKAVFRHGTRTQFSG